MNVVAIARPYAKAAFELAKAAEALTEWEHSLHHAALLLSDITAKKALTHPDVSTQAAAAFVLKSMPYKVDPAFARLIDLLAERRRLLALPAIFEYFSLLKKESEKVLDVELITAVKPESAFVERIKQQLSARLKKTIALQETVDPSILGGAMIKMTDTVIDGSVRGKLAKIADVLMA